MLTAAIAEGVKSVICLSTDKAAYPVNAMGTSKTMMKKVIVANLYNIKDGKYRAGNISVEEIFEYDLDTDVSLLKAYCKEADFVFNLAGVNRPKEQSEFMEGNFGFASTLLDALKKHNNTCVGLCYPVLFRLP